METIYSNIKNDRQMRSSTGMTKKMFEKLLFLFKEAYETLEGASVAERNRDNGSLSKNSVLPSKIQQSKQYTSDLSNFLIGEYLGKNKNRVAQIENIGV